ncbi:polysaccharide deacetylase family protein [Evansella cellulosilytica]|uniref:Polysaccharide deacetylase n=1 Tax=Evansella cellulosilytica (strain ATCC 21833 / DSM 2522 / FERM P-1141 / JCM 9156 / N-4) TaxID=649639 RepID=E6TR85_EVAC2|nr:polysaccharide deacetylase family protein [Evansella cellulosilytica]ADU30597.1 polysaccharide deacetylase [Evansella cellulosilytica DSM 2522]
MGYGILRVTLIAMMFFSLLPFIYAHAEFEKVAEPVWWWNKDRQNEDIPNPEGGPETERIRQPVSNILLQQRYPNIVVLQGDSGDNRVALTFDDGPDPRYTEQVLDVLSEFNVPATFFVMGARAEAYPEIVQRTAEEGHIIGNHTYWHPNLVDENIDTLEREITETENVLAEIIGYRTSLFRAPYGFLDDEFVQKIGEMNYSVVAWSVDSLDWQEDPADEIAYTVLSNTHPGAIILMHDGAEWEGDRTNTIEALRQIIPSLQEQGVEFVTVPDLLGIPYQQ